MTASKRTVLILGVNNRTQVQPGVWENHVSEKTLKAQQEQVYQSRTDTAAADGQIIRGRFRVRYGLEPTENIDYAIWRSKKYKISYINRTLGPHDMVLELGELS